MLRKLFVLTIGLYSSFTFAHPGHDHNHWLSEPIHLLTAGAVITILAAIGYRMKTQTNTQRKEK